MDQAVLCFQSVEASQLKQIFKKLRKTFRQLNTVIFSSTQHPLRPSCLIFQNNLAPGVLVYLAASPFIWMHK